jgi:hypothetical protein
MRKQSGFVLGSSRESQRGHLRRWFSFLRPKLKVGLDTGELVERVGEDPTNMIDFITINTLNWERPK